MKTRLLQNNSEVEELDFPLILEIKTRCPEKWTLIDNETGEKYQGTNSIEKYRQWRKISNA
jgi:hypothetical protein